MHCPTSLHDRAPTILLNSLVPVAALDGRCSAHVLPDVASQGNLHSIMPRPIAPTIYFYTYRKFLYFIDFCHALHVGARLINNLTELKTTWNVSHYVGIDLKREITCHDSIQPYVASTSLSNSPCFLLDARACHMIANGVSYASIIDYLTATDESCTKLLESGV